MSPTWTGEPCGLRLPAEAGSERCSPPAGCRSPTAQRGDRGAARCDRPPAQARQHPRGGDGPCSSPPRWTCCRVPRTALSVHAQEWPGTPAGGGLLGSKGQKTGAGFKDCVCEFLWEATAGPRDSSGINGPPMRSPVLGAALLSRAGIPLTALWEEQPAAPAQSSAPNRGSSQAWLWGRLRGSVGWEDSTSASGAPHLHCRPLS